jgi:DNA-directed RNA polymerase II subunit RPB1
MSLINELRFVLRSYGIYVNYRHLSTLCDVMTQRGIITSITRHGINRGDSGPLRKCSFEETVEILLEAAVYSEVDPLKGITENLIMGQLGPFGTGCFDLVVDRECIEANAIAKPEDDENKGGDTDYEMDEHRDYDIATPIQNMTPHHNNFPGSEYSSMTPGYTGGFSPGPNMVMSPAYSPGYMSPAYRTQNSPVYGAYASPIYNVSTDNVPNQMGQQNPSMMQPSSGYSGGPSGYISSPVYSGAIGSRKSPTYSPANKVGETSGYSPTNYNM